MNNAKEKQEKHGGLPQGASRQHQRRIGARPLGCRNAGIVRALKLVRCRRWCFARFCSLKAALRCAPWSSVPGGTVEMRPLPQGAFLLLAAAAWLLCAGCEG